MARLVVVAVLLVPLLACARDRDAPPSAQPFATLTPLPPRLPPTPPADSPPPAPVPAPVVVAEAEPPPAPRRRHHHHRSQSPAPGSLQALLAANPQLSQLNLNRFGSMRVTPIRPVVRPAPPLTGPAARANVMHLVTQNVSVFRHCYETALLATPQLTGRVVLHFTVQTNGYPTALNVEHGAGMDGVAACITRSVERWQFAPIDAAIPVDFPILLSP